MNKQNDRVSVVMIRHAQSQWNKENRFTGWADPPLTNKGLEEAKQAAEGLRSNGYHFDMAYSSRLKRAIKTGELILAKLMQDDIPYFQDWRLNERHYGTLQGINKQEAASSVGEKQVWRWRRGYEDRAKPLLVTDANHPINDSRYADIDASILPSVENLAETRARATAFWEQMIKPQIQQSRRLLISAHGNTLRALIMELSKMTVEEVEGFEIPTATPIIYHFNQQGKALDWHYLSPGDVLKSA